MPTADHPTPPHFDLTEDQASIRDSVREFAQGELAGAARAIDEQAALPTDFLEQVAELGLLGMPFGEEVGGAGVDWLSFVLATEEIAEASAAAAYVLVAHTGLACGTIHALASEAQRASLLPPLAGGEAVAALAHAEPHLGVDLATMHTVATPAGDDQPGAFVLRGVKPFVAGAGLAQQFVVTARPTEPKGEEVLVALLQPDTPGVVVKEAESLLGMRGADVRAISIEGATVPADQVLGGGWIDAGRLAEALAPGQLGMTAIALGIGRAAMTQAADYGLARHQFNAAIATFPAIQFKLAEMDARLAGARHALYHAARLADAGRPFAREAAIARYLAGDAARQVTFDAIQVFGGAGYSREYPLERLWRDAKLTAVAEGKLEAQQYAIAQHLLRRD